MIGEDRVGKALQLGAAKTIMRRECGICGAKQRLRRLTERPSQTCARFSRKSQMEAKSLPILAGADRFPQCNIFIDNLKIGDKILTLIETIVPLQSPKKL
jgi:hypothetical protein